MKYSVKIENGRKIVKGSYLPKGYSCPCKSCGFTIEVMKETSDEQVKELIEKLKTL